MPRIPASIKLRQEDSKFEAMLSLKTLLQKKKKSKDPQRALSCIHLVYFSQLPHKTAMNVPAFQRRRPGSETLTRSQTAKCSVRVRTHELHSCIELLLSCRVPSSTPCHNSSAHSCLAQRHPSPGSMNNRPGETERKK